MRKRPFILVIGGPTASGKSRLAMELARILPVEIVSADSMQVYRGLDIGTAKPNTSDRESVPHHLIDLKDPDEPFSAGEYSELVRTRVPEIKARGRIPVMVGGTGLYIRAALGGIFPGPARDDELRASLHEEERENRGTLHSKLLEADPLSAQRINPSDIGRIIRALEVYHLTGRPISVQQEEHTFSDRPFETEYLCLEPPREILYGWIEDRIDRMIEKGLLEEVKGLLDQGYGPHLNSMKALGYREIATHLLGDCDFQRTVELFKRNTRRYAKRQITWFRKEPEAVWRRVESLEDIKSLARQLAEEVAAKTDSD